MRYTIGDAGGSLLPSKADAAAMQAAQRNAYLHTAVTAAPRARLPSAARLTLAPTGPRGGGFALAGGAAPSSGASSPSTTADAGSFGDGGIRSAGSSIAVTALPGFGGGGGSGAIASDPGVLAPAPSPILPALTQKLAVPALPQDHNGPSSLEWAGIGAAVLALAVGAYFVFR